MRATAAKLQSLAEEKPGEERVIEKSPDAFRTISEVSQLLELPAHVLRFWETRFSQIKPVKRGGGRRYYRPSDVDLIRGIRELLHNDGLTIKGAQKVLREKGVRHVVQIGADLAPDIEEPVAAQAQLPLAPVAEETPAPTQGTGLQLNAAQRKDLREIVVRLEMVRARMLVS